MSKWSHLCRPINDYDFLYVLTPKGFRKRKSMVKNFELNRGLNLDQVLFWADILLNMRHTRRYILEALLQLFTTLFMWRVRYTINGKYIHANIIYFRYEA